MLLALDKVAKLYGDKLVFKGVTCVLEPGRICIVAGPNGAGKSTLLRIMAGLARADSGKVERGVEREEIGYLGHQTFIYPGLSGLENLAFWARMHEKSAAPAALLQALERVELAHAAHERAGDYSRGMAQRLNLARLFLLGPKLILLDEPGTGLDVRSSGILAREIETAQQNGAGVVWVSHHVEKDASMADKVLEIRDRAMTYFGPAGEYVPGSVPPEAVAAENGQEARA